MLNKLTRNHLILPIALAIFLFFIFYACSETESIHLVILHSNDTHGNLITYDKANQIGGIAKTAKLIKQIKEENKDSTLILHAGDELSRGDELTACFGGEVNMRAMEMMGYDAFTPGNGDFYFGIQNFIKQTSLVKFPILHANVTYKGSDKPIFQPYIIKEINGIKVGILGIGVIREEHPSGRNLRLLDPINIAKKIVPELQKKSDIIIALTHIGIGADILLAEKVPQIDIIIGGHTHNKLDKPMMVPRKNGSGEVIVVQAGEYTQYLGRLDIYVKKESDHYRIIKSEGKLIPIDKNVKEDETIANFLKQWTDKLSQVVYKSPTDIANSKTPDSPMGKFLAEAVRVETDSDVSLLDLGSAQSGIKAGDVTVRDIYKIHPWRNRVLIYSLTGDQLQKVLSEKVLYASGCSYKKANATISELMIGDNPIELKKVYKIAMDEFLSFSTKALDSVPYFETEGTIDSIFLKYISKH